LKRKGFCNRFPQGNRFFYPVFPGFSRFFPQNREKERSLAGRSKIIYPPDGTLIEWRGEKVPLEAISAAGRSTHGTMRLSP
jgi:hypothetical protein